ncbi:MAG TPA: hypothetical protein VGB79_09645 [Allosphingosinicella sp.]|jgi:hypothetical protein
MQLLAAELAEELRALDFEVSFDPEGRIVLPDAQAARAIREAFEAEQPARRAGENKGCVDLKNLWCPAVAEQRRN